MNDNDIRVFDEHGKLRLAEALREHALRTGGLMVGDTVTLGIYTIQITGGEGAEFTFEFDYSDVYRDEYGRRRSREMCQCSHHIDSHDENGRCQSGDDDGDGYFDQCYCEEFRDRLLSP